MAIVFGSPEALAILKADKALEKALEADQPIMLTIAAMEARKHWPKAKEYFSALQRVDEARAELEDAECELEDILRKIKDTHPDVGCDLADINEDDWEMWKKLPQNAKDFFLAQVK